MPGIGTTPAAALTVALLALSGCSGGESDDLAGGESEIIGDADEGIDGVKAIRVADNTHTESIVDYQLRPPAGGAHNPVWWNCGFYDEVIPDEHVVHDLEHGAVWLAYSPDLPEDEIEVIHELARANLKVIAAPYPGLDPDEAVVATAWARQLRPDSVDDARLSEFVAQYQDGSQPPESGAPCNGSPLGAPLP